MNRCMRGAVAALAGTLGSAAALAHGGHPVPAGVPPVAHVHLWGDTVMSANGLLVLAIIALGAIGWGVRRLRAQRSPGSTRGRHRVRR